MRARFWRSRRERHKDRKPDGGEGRRMGKPFLDDDSLTFHEFNRVNVPSPRLEVGDGLRALHALADRSDVLIHNCVRRTETLASIRTFLRASSALDLLRDLGLRSAWTDAARSGLRTARPSHERMVTINGDPAGRRPVAIPRRYGTGIGRHRLAGRPTPAGGNGADASCEPRCSRRPSAGSRSASIPW